jgi:hypothetical protein
MKKKIDLNFWKKKKQNPSKERNKWRKMKGSWYSQECLWTCTSLTSPAKVSMMKETRLFSLQENVVFSHTKSRGSWHMCEENFEVSSITMHNMWYLLCLILYIKMKIWHYIMTRICEFFFLIFIFCFFFFPSKREFMIEWYISIIFCAK